MFPLACQCYSCERERNKIKGGSAWQITDGDFKHSKNLTINISIMDFTFAFSYFKYFIKPHNELFMRLTLCSRKIMKGLD